jgi:DNA-binding NarL/FixJ family response regulator
LTPREREVLQALAQGQSTKEIAFSLELSPKTVETHRMHLMSKLQVTNLADLTRLAIREGYVSL